LAERAVGKDRSGVKIASAAFESAGSDRGTRAMSDEEVKKIWRTLHLKFTLPGADSEQLSSLIRSAAPFFQMFGNAHFRLLQNADDPTKFIQVIEYETHEAFELNRQSLASDMRFQAYLQAWRAMLPGALEIDVYQEV
jgi:quinol monooxygenase YgiN